MVNQTFKLMADVDNRKEVGFISKNEDEYMILNLNGFWESIFSKKMKLVNIDDFIGTIFCGDEHGTAVIECESASSDNLIVHFNGNQHDKIEASGVEISVYAPIAGKVFSVMVYHVEDVTGKVMLS